MNGEVPDVWTQEATDEDVSYAVTTMITAVDQDMDPQRIPVMKRLVKTRDYSRAELMYAMQELPFRNHYGQGFRLDLLDEIIKEHRKDRERLSRLVTSEEMHGLVERHRELRKADFHFARFGEGYENRETKLFRYAPHVKRDTKRPEPTAYLEESTPQRREDGTEMSTAELIRHTIDSMNNNSNNE